MDISADNLKNLEKQGKDMEREGHFDSKSILKSIKDFDRRFNALRAPVAERREKLEASLLWHQFNFDADTELLWIDEHIPMTSSTDYGKSLSDTQILNAKHKVLIYFIYVYFIFTFHKMYCKIIFNNINLFLFFIIYIL